MKRVLFIINKMNFRPSSGHGIFMKGAIDTFLENGHFIDVLSDGEPDENFLKDYNINFFFPDKADRLAYSKHSALYQFSDSFNFEKAINFRTAITKALSSNVYDLIICNDTESAFVCYQMELYKHIHVTSYAHECASINPELGAGVFKDCYYNLIEQMMYFPITTLLQTEQNKAKILPLLPFPNPNLYVQLYPLTDAKKTEVKERDGLLYIGRHEDRKNPAEYIKVLKAIKDKYGIELKANVMTRSAHVKKFEADFASIGHTNYEIVADVVGEEKARIIQSSKVAFMPYKNESFGIAVLEALRYMPTIVLDKFDWHYNFESFSNYIVADSKEAADIIWSAYNTWTVDHDKVNAEFAEYQNKYEQSLLGLLDGPIISKGKEPRNRLYTYLQDNKGTWIDLNKYFQSENSKGVIYLTSDIETIYVNRAWFEIKQTEKETYLGILDEAGKLEHKELDTNDESFFSFYR
jgi:glycosyltransferase involved in cell wall biosynthesis